MRRGGFGAKSSKGKVIDWQLALHWPITALALRGPSHLAPHQLASRIVSCWDGKEGVREGGREGGKDGRGSKAGIE
jgi:hypothetical protein